VAAALDGRMIDGRHVTLAGFMGAGKTAVGRRLASALGRPFVDTDALIEAEAGMSVAAIFTREGEAAFRARERKAVAAACAMPPAVIAVGGGALGDAESRRRLLEAGPVIYLRATPEALLERVGDAATRPLLASAPTAAERLARIRTLLAEREPIYACATHVVDTTGLPLDAVVRRIRALLVEER